MSGRKLDEPISTISAVLTMRQIVWLNEKADERGVKRTHVLREVVEKGIEASEAEDAEKAPVAA